MKSHTGSSSKSYIPYQITSLKQFVELLIFDPLVDSMIIDLKLAHRSRHLYVSLMAR